MKLTATGRLKGQDTTNEPQVIIWDNAQLLGDAALLLDLLDASLAPVDLMPARHLVNPLLDPQGFLVVCRRVLDGIEVQAENLPLGLILEDNELIVETEEGGVQ